MNIKKPTSYIQQTRELYDSLGYPPYNWFHADDDPPFSVPKKLLAQSRVGLVSTAGTYVQGQVAYYYKDDTSIRAIPVDTPVDKLRFSHVTENYLVDARDDPRCVFPIEALARLRDEGVIGDLASNFYSCMGGIYSQRRVREELIPRLEAAVTHEALDSLLLVPL
ncbi:MAG: hypothetical protein HUJ31_13930 [Pseudomonadales bacterium]|nr:hypothetical protein [Pseudomonadales bacterium]